ncbi:MAG: LVIVD repeat-containing protein, partial [Ginsengibacter sp.]
PGVFYAASQAMKNSNGSMAPIGLTGSMARFAIAKNYLYTVSNADLNIFNISDAISPAFSNKVQVDWHVETIYPFADKLFIGSNNGMYMYDISSSPDNPVPLGEFTHVRSCDPVIADDKYAFVTLHSGTTCLGFNNELDVLQLNDFTNSSLLKIYDMSSPHGLSKDGNLLFICDGTDGLKIFNATDVMNLRLIKHFSNLETFDVIANNNVALVVASDGLYQYDYSDVNNIHLVSKINVLKN